MVIGECKENIRVQEGQEKSSNLCKGSLSVQRGNKREDEDEDEREN